MSLFLKQMQIAEFTHVLGQLYNWAFYELTAYR